MHQETEGEKRECAVTSPRHTLLGQAEVQNNVCFFQVRALR